MLLLLPIKRRARSLPAAISLPRSRKAINGSDSSHSCRVLQELKWPEDIASNRSVASRGDRERIRHSASARSFELLAALMRTLLSYLSAPQQNCLELLQ